MTMEPADYLISRSAALAKAEFFGEHATVDNPFADGCEAVRVEDIYSLPTVDHIDVVRCHECKHSDTYPPGSNNSTPLKCLGIRYGGVFPDWYCEHGDRRDGHGNE